MIRRTAAIVCLAAGIALAVTAGALAAKPKTGTFKGFTAQSNDKGQRAPVGLLVVGRGRVIWKASWGLRAVCHNVPDAFLFENAGGILVSRRGSFSLAPKTNARQPAPTGINAAGPYPAGSQIQTRLVKLAGRFVTSKKAKGTLHFTMAVFDSSGNQIDNCDTGTVAWTASR